MQKNNERIITDLDYIKEYHEVCERRHSSLIRFKEYLEGKKDPALMEEIERLPPIINKISKRIELLSALEATF